ncbi:COBRA-like protein 7 [Phoenix dactylifera]|uniref:COBRA-like protein 7 n=1 Tax=Phoenix dactylifera TaxID=42345 RepID=A0A8B7C3D5_PHODC|nr:COBRA-like protein 7 [Phoenix dactylifera]
MASPESRFHLHRILVFVSFLLLLFRPSRSQQGSPPDASAPAPSSSDCNGVLLTYDFQRGQRLRPFVQDPNKQTWAFTATATILNSGTADLDAWELLIGFRHREILVSASPAILTDGSPFPYSTPNDSATSFSGFPNHNLKYPIEVAGDLSQISVQISIGGIFFGSPPPAVPLPSSLSLADPAFSCPVPVVPSSTSTSITTCCLPNPDFNSNTTTNSSDADGSDSFLPRRSGDLTISYDVIQAFPSSYLALVTIDNHSPRGRLDNWRLSWEWMRDEFIYSMKGAYPLLVDVSDCIYGRQGEYYEDLDFSKVLSCQTKPTILDLPPSKFNDTDLGRIPSCCRNGTILPASMDPSQSSSAFQVQVFKMPPDLNRTDLHPPRNWRISGSTINPEYKCGQPIRVSPALFPDPSGLESNTSAIASWQVVCNISTPKGASPKCCVSFSAFYNDSVVPCKTCACGCPANRGGRTCNATAPALLLPAEALLVPFDNRTAGARAWAEIKQFHVPSPIPCGDNCGVSINWHINTDYTRGWSARMTLFNWEEVNFADWFVAVEMGKAYDGYEDTYSFNGTKMGNNTIFIQGLPGLNYLVAETDGANPATDPRVPGKQQSVISFTKRTAPGINVAQGDGFPSKVFFNGEECSLPDIIPTSQGFRSGGAVGLFSCVLLLVASTLLLLHQ